jgi:hypothetical protein
MKKKMFIGIIGGISIIATSILIYNYYLIPVFRHNEMMSKIDEIDKRLKKIEIILLISIKKKSPKTIIFLLVGCGLWSWVGWGS